MSLQTFQAFSHAASDEQTKDAVLMEATRAIFGNTQTGYIDGVEVTPESKVKILEVVKSVVSGKTGE